MNDERREEIARALDVALRQYWLVFPRQFDGTPEEFAEARLDLSRAAVKCVLWAAFDAESPSAAPPRP